MPPVPTATDGVYIATPEAGNGGDAGPDRQVHGDAVSSHFGQVLHLEVVIVVGPLAAGEHLLGNLFHGEVRIALRAAF